jgi:DNA topoisomerase-3
MLLWPCREIQSHIPEPFWYIAVSYRPDPANEGQQQQQQQQQGPQQRRQGQPSCEFKWARDRLFDQGVATLLYEQCAEEPTATVMQASAAA